MVVLVAAAYAGIAGPAKAVSAVSANRTLRINFMEDTPDFKTQPSDRQDDLAVHVLTSWTKWLPKGFLHFAPLSTGGCPTAGIYSRSAVSTNLSWEAPQPRPCNDEE